MNSTRFAPVVTCVGAGAAERDRYKDMMISQNLQRRSLQMLTEWKDPRPQVPPFAARRLFLGKRAVHGMGFHFIRKQYGGQLWGRREPRL